MTSALVPIPPIDAVPEGLRLLEKFLQGKIENAGLAGRLSTGIVATANLPAGACSVLMNGAWSLVLQARHDCHWPQSALGALSSAWRDLHEAGRQEVLLLEELAVDWESLQALYDLSADLQSELGREELLRRILVRATANVTNGSALLLLAKNQSLTPLAWSNTPEPEAFQTKSGLVGRVLQEGHALVLNGSARIAGTPGLETLWAGAASIALTPITMPQHGLFGIIAVWSPDRQSGFDSHLVRLLEALGQQIALVVESDRLNRTLRESDLLRQEMQIGSLIQQMLLLGEPPRRHPYFDVEAINFPSQMIDGDFVEVFPLEGGCLEVLIGDVMGKGIPAALIGAATKNHILRAAAETLLASRSAEVGLEAVINRASVRIAPSLMALERFVTLSFAVLNPIRGTVQWVDCGHTSTLHFHAKDGTITSLKGEGLPLGVLEQERYNAACEPLEPGDLLFFYSDGVTEAQNAQRELFGEQRLSRIVAALANDGSAALLGEVRRQVVAFSGSEQFADDFTCLAVRLRRLNERPGFASEFSMPAVLTQLPRLHQWCDSFLFAPDSEMPRETAHLVHLALIEAATNCIRHACGDTPSKQLRFYAACCPDRWVFEIEHDGSPWSPQEESQLPAEGTGGFGLYIIDQVMQEQRYLRLPSGRNRLLMTRLRSFNQEKAKEK
jgi:phosphoserine phosphatase RsbU/P